MAEFKMKEVKVSHSVMSDSFRPHGLMSPLARLLCSWDSPGKNTGVGCHFLLQGNLPDPGIEPVSPPLQVNSLPAELSEKPTIEGSKSYIMTFCLNEMSTGRQSACAG